MLLVNSPEVTTILGESAAKLRLIEGLNLTNLTAENSSAKFYLREVGYITYKIPAASLLDAISVGRSDTTVQSERKRVLADGVYYQGNEPGAGGCGWAWINASSYNMIAQMILQVVQLLQCVMRLGTTWVSIMVTQLILSCISYTSIRKYSIRWK